MAIWRFADFISQKQGGATICFIAERIGEESAVLLDPEGIRRYRKLNRRRGAKIPVRLNRTFGLYLRLIDKLLFIKDYLVDSFTDCRQARRRITAVIEQSR
jgi:hypothetical protein